MNYDFELEGYLQGHLLIAAPYMQDARFHQSVLLICGHEPGGAMALAINKPLPDLSFNSLIKQLDVDLPSPLVPVKLFSGGPIEPGRGFVLHSNDYRRQDSMIVNDQFAVTATVDVLEAIAKDHNSPKHSIIALGYAGWGAGQLEDELQQPGWLTMPADTDIVFNTSPEQKWQKSMNKLRIDVNMLTGDVGHS